MLVLYATSAPSCLLPSIDCPKDCSEAQKACTGQEAGTSHSNQISIHKVHGVQALVAKAHPLPVTCHCKVHLQQHRRLLGVEAVMAPPAR